jgi:hypothetical protein
MSLQALDPQMALAPDDSIVLAGTFWNHELDFGAFGPDAAPSSTRLTSAGSEDIYLAKLDAEGGLVWQEGFGNSQVQTASLGLVTSPDGSILLAGRSSGSLDLGSLHLEAGDSASPFVAAFDVDGNALSAITLGTSAYAEGADGLVVDDCLRFYLAADYSGDLAAPNVVQRGATIGLTLILGKY